ncbi:hypothetical protein [Nocardioides sp. 1609]|uniref:hypothetical protein n=1 Tax=Nocardioides sp. 1609 TaxID=2508327 RepID=UPI00106FD4D5|nr:hypothetical protein [Nocardioides sp. 1609]
MSDPLADRLRDLATGTPAMNPASPTDVRRRGDRLRRRRTALTTAGGALAVGLVATPVFVLTHGDAGGDPQPAPPPSTSSAAPTDPPSPDPTTPDDDPSSSPLPATLLPAAGDLPTRDRLTPWEEVEPTDSRLVGCQPDGEVEADQVVARSFTARIAAADGLPEGEDVAAEVRVSVLQYPTTADGETAEAAVTGWIRDCTDPGDPALDGASRQGDLVETGAGTYATWVYSAPEACTDDCDAVWFDRMGVVADQGRMVVVSYRELGGPLQPDGLDATMRDVLLQAAGRGLPG